MYSIKIITSVLLLAAVVFAGEWQVKASDQNMVKFISDAPVEDFEGVTSEIDGYLFWEGEDMLNKSDLYFEVNLNSLDTGIGLRNRHMRENYLETDQYPTTHFKGSLVKLEETSAGTYKVLAQGKMFIHGKERLKSIEAEIEKKGQFLHIKSACDVKLTDYGITVPSIMFYKINETMELKLDFILHQPKT